MAHAGFWTAALIATGMIGFAPHDAHADAVGPYYATPSWDQTLPASTRFIVLSNMNSEAVLDRETGLVWQRTPKSGTVTWAEAVFDCANNVGTGGRYGWRLPSIHELASLVNPAGGIAAGSPFLNVAQGDAAYWSTTAFPGGPDVALVRGFPAGGFISGSTTKSTPFGLEWCVRGGQGVNSNPF